MFFAKLLTLGAVVVASSSMAFADTIQLNGGVTIDTTSGSVMFDNSKSAVTYSGTGVFSAFTLSSAVNYMDFTYNPSTPAGTELVSITNAGETLNFFMTMENASSSYNSVTGITSYELQGLGFYDLMTGGTTTVINGAFDITTQGQGANTTNLSFSDINVGASSVTPEPNSLILLSTGLFGAAGLMYMSRRKALNQF